jgi:hypothetical protein
MHNLLILFHQNRKDRLAAAHLISLGKDERRVHWFLVEEGSVSGVQVLNPPVIVVVGKAGMVSGYRTIIDEEIAGRVPSNQDLGGIEVMRGWLFFQLDEQSQERRFPERSSLDLLFQIPP